MRIPPSTCDAPNSSRSWHHLRLEKAGQKSRGYDIHRLTRGVCKSQTHLNILCALHHLQRSLFSAPAPHPELCPHQTPRSGHGSAGPRSPLSCFCTVWGFFPCSWVQPVRSRAAPGARRGRRCPPGRSGRRVPAGPGCYAKVTVPPQIRRGGGGAQRRREHARR